MEAVQTIACIGSGVIGASWAALFAAKGFFVQLYDLDAPLLEKARVRVEGILSSMTQNRLYTPEEMAAASGRIAYTSDMARALSQVRFIQESTPDSLDIKKSVFAQIEVCCPPDAVIASSTSNLLISEIAAAARRPERCIGAHPYNPPHLMPLVEITKNPHTGQDTIETAVSLYKACGKVPVVLQKESLGFVSNRLQMALYREAVHIVMEGICSVEDVDAVTTFGPALRWAILGPNMLFYLGGGEGGLKGLLTNLREGGDALLADLSTASSQPQEWLDIGQAGVLEELKHMPAYIGNTPEAVAQFRDSSLITLLKLHHKL